MKIFVIGFNKTGTCSFDSLFRDLGIKSIHTDKPIMSIIDKYDAFSDGDHYCFEEYYNKYPDSLFILNTRPISNWLISRYKHAHYHKFYKCWCWPVSKEKTNTWIRERELHYQHILDFFLDKPNQLLIVNIEKTGWEQAVSLFIDSYQNYTKTHYKHKTQSFMFDKELIMLIQENVSKCLDAAGYSGDELLSNTADITLYKYKTWL